MLALEIGEKPTAEKLGIPYDRIRQWSHRYGWKRTSLSIQQPVTVVTVRPADVLQDTLAEHERETRLSLARYARRVSKVSEKASIKHAGLVHKVAQVAGLVHKWDSEKSNQTFTLNVLNINSLDNRLGGEEGASDTIDA